MARDCQTFTGTPQILCKNFTPSLQRIFLMRTFLIPASTSPTRTISWTWSRGAPRHPRSTSSALTTRGRRTGRSSTLSTAWRRRSLRRAGSSGPSPGLLPSAPNPTKRSKTFPIIFLPILSLFPRVFTFSFRSFSPMPGGIEFLPGQVLFFLPLRQFSFLGNLVFAPRGYCWLD